MRLLDESQRRQSLRERRRGLPRRNPVRELDDLCRVDGSVLGERSARSVGTDEVTDGEVGNASTEGDDGTAVLVAENEGEGGLVDAAAEVCGGTGEREESREVESGE